MKTAMTIKERIKEEEGIDKTNKQRKEDKCKGRKKDKIKGREN